MYNLFKLSKKTAYLGNHIRKNGTLYNEYLELLEFTNFLPVNTSVKERLYYVEHNINKIVKCHTCEKKANWSNRGKNKNTYKKYCSVCAYKSPERYKKIKQTNLNRYGVENVLQSKEVKDKIKQTNLERYGVEHALQSKEVKDKIKKTNLERYGVEHTLQSKEVKDKIKQTNLDKYGVEHALQSEEIKDKIKQTNLDKYGVEHALQSEEIKDKIKQTNLDKYGVEHALQSEEIKDKIKKTNLDKYGVEHPSQSKEVKDKIKQTNLERYGVEHTLQSEEVKDKIKQTNLDKYGVEHALQNKEIQDKMKKTMLINHGVEHALQSKEVKDKIKQTNLDKYGVENPSQSKEVKDKIKKTNLDKYGVENVLQSEEVKDKIKKTNSDKYGVEHPSQSKEVKDKIKQTNLERYGVEHTLQSEEVKDKIKQTNLDKYGVENPSQSKEVKDKIKQTNLDKYGVENVLKSKEVKDKIKQIVSKKGYIKKQKLAKSLNLTLLKHNNITKEVTYRCNTCNTVRTTIYPYLRCITCFPYNISSGEKEVLEFIKNSYKGNIICNSRAIIPPFELDIYLPEKNIAIEYDGLYWHSELAGKDKHYHISKTNLCLERGIQLFHIFENEWIQSPTQNIWKSIISNRLYNSKRIFARKCQVREISFTETKEFLIKNHLQGTINSKINLGLIYHDEIVAVMTFSKPRYNKNYSWELLRFCNKLNYNTIGGASKLLKYFTKRYKGTIISYADLRRGNGKLYEKLGFNKMHISPANFFYFKNINHLHSRLEFQKYKLAKKLKTFDPTLTGWENMQNNGWNRIWDCGNIVFTLN